MPRWLSQFVALFTDKRYPEDQSSAMLVGVLAVSLGVAAIAT